MSREQEVPGVGGVNRPGYISPTRLQVSEPVTDSGENSGRAEYQAESSSYSAPIPYWHGLRVVLLACGLALCCAPPPVVRPEPRPAVRCGMVPVPVWRGVNVQVQPDGSALIPPEDARALQLNIRQLRQWAAEAAACEVEAPDAGAASP